MIRKKKPEERKLTKIEKRVESLPTSELMPWSEQSIYTIGRNLASWQRSQDNAYLEEARLGAEVLHTILESLARRHTV